MSSNATVGIVLVVIVISLTGIVASIYCCRYQDSKWSGHQQPSSGSRSRNRYTLRNTNNTAPGIQLGTFFPQQPFQRNRPPAVQNRANFRANSPLLPQIPVFPRVLPPTSYHQPNRRYIVSPWAQPPQVHQAPLSTPPSPRNLQNQPHQSPPNVQIPPPALAPATPGAQGLKGILKKPRQRGT